MCRCELAGKRSLGHEELAVALAVFPIEERFLEYHLDRDLAVLKRIKGLVDSARGTLAQLFDDLELPDLVHRGRQTRHDPMSAEYPCKHNSILNFTAFCFLLRSSSSSWRNSLNRASALES